jgi:general secretion pathway protein D
LPAANTQTPGYLPKTNTSIENTLSVQRSGQGLSLNFVNADIEAVARTLASLLDKNIVVDPKVHGALSLSTEKPITTQEAWNLFLASLRLQAFSVVEVNGLFKVIPEADAKLQGGGVNLSAKASNANTVNANTSFNSMGNNSGQVLTQIFKLEHENANNLISVLRPLISPNNTINVNANSNALVITDYSDNLQRLARIIANLDSASAGEVEVVALKHAIATDLAPLVSKLLDPSVALNTGAAPATPGAEGNFKTTLIAEPKSNSIIIRAATPGKAQQALSLIGKLDQPSSQRASGDIHVVYLKNADATKLANTLRAALASEARLGGGTSPYGSNFSSVTATPSTPSLSGSGMGLGATPNTLSTQTMGSTSGVSQATTGGQIQADTTTNSLIITAPEPQYRQLRSVIDELDGRRAQVMVEALIAEVDATKASQYGIQWQNFLSKGAGATAVGTNFGSGGNNILGLALAGAAGALSGTTPGAGLNIASFNNVHGAYVLSTLANFLQQDGGTNILSTPTLLTLDNEEARIVVGQNVPFVTGQYTNNASVNGAVNPFQTIERKDVGLTLKIKPQISETGTIKMMIYQEVSSVDPTSVGSVSGLITNKRAIESSVLVEDGSVVVLGGLLSDEYDGSKNQVPGFGDIPVLGNLFKNENRTRKKTNLMVFIRPQILRDAKATESYSQGKYEQMLGQQSSARVEGNAIMPVENTISLPALNPKSVDATAASATPK